MGFQLLTILLIFMFSVFGCTGGDFLHYKELFFRNLNSQEPIHYEIFYYKIVSISHQNYYIWRLLVWGPASMVLYIFTKKLKTDADFAYFIFTMFLLIYFPSPRQSLGFMVMYLGFLYIIQWRNHFKSLIGILWGFTLVAFSTTFHSTMPIFIVIEIFCLFPFAKSKTALIISLICFPILYLSIQNSSLFFLEYILNNDSDALEKATRYIESDFRVRSNMMGILRIILNKTPYLIIIIWSFVTLVLKRNSNTHITGDMVTKVIDATEESDVTEGDSNKVSRFFLFSAYYHIYISYLFAGNDVSAFLGPRLWEASMYPLTFFAMIYLREFYHKKILRYALLLLLVSNLFNLAYAVYSVDKFNSEYLL